MRAKAEHLGPWRGTPRVSLAIATLALGAWLVVDHPGIAGAAKGAPASAKRASVPHAATGIHVVEHAVTDTVIHTGGPEDATGNLLTFHNKVYNAADTKQVGTDQGSCIRIAPSEGSFECSWTTVLAEGQLMVQGPFYDTKNSVLAITGGTGAFRRARGEMKLVSRNGGKEYDFIFRLS